MTSDGPKTFRQLLEALTGQQPPRSEPTPVSFPENGLGYSQMNEALLLLGYDRVTHAFFQFLVDDTLEYTSGSEIRSVGQMATGVDRANKLALLFFGNVKFGFKTPARNAEELSYYHALVQPIENHVFENRHEPIFPVEKIDAQETYYLGYLVQREIQRRLSDDPNDEAALRDQGKLGAVRKRGIRNQQAYLVSDHLDVYVATSMRQRHEYVEVAEFTARVFEHEALRGLNLRWFDPTLALLPQELRTTTIFPVESMR